MRFIKKIKSIFDISIFFNTWLELPFIKWTWFLNFFNKFDTAQAVQQALHTTVSTRQSRKGEISSWKAYAPAHAGKLAIEAVDRVMRGEGAPSPIYEGEDSVIARGSNGRFNCSRS